MSAQTTTIADLPPWYFWALPETIGSTKEEARLVDRLDPARLAQLNQNIAAARDYLRDAVPPGRDEPLPDPCPALRCRQVN